ncbi:MAG: helix-turn-helix transcriptional regulator [Clostridia bacterium]|nr:helix-turn-helix transcriptional regulator [Clostridia bacterium]MBR6794036.1 helix-turn-helix transcriptional regulator [Clostridia bacterium]
MEYITIIQKRIRYFCDKKGISINKLANMCALRQSTLDNIMRGVSKNPGIKTLHKIANAFNMTVAEFLDYEELNDYSFADREEN